MRASAAASLLVLSVTACVRFVPATEPPPRERLRVEAPFDATWNATVDFFAEQNRPFSTIDKPSGIIVAEALIVVGTNKERLQFAQCGTLGIIAYGPTSAIYNVRVEPDGENASRIRANVRFVHVDDGRNYSCASTGRWERQLEAFVAERAVQRDR